MLHDLLLTAVGWTAAFIQLKAIRHSIRDRRDQARTDLAEVRDLFKRTVEQHQNAQELLQRSYQLEKTARALLQESESDYDPHDPR